MIVVDHAATAVDRVAITVATQHAQHKAYQLQIHAAIQDATHVAMIADAQPKRPAYPNMEYGLKVA